MAVEVGVGRGNLDGAAPLSASKERLGGRIGKCGTVDVDQVVVKSLDQRRGGGVPESVRRFGHIKPGANADLNFLCIGCGDAEHGTIVRKDTGVRSPRNIKR